MMKAPNYQQKKVPSATINFSGQNCTVMYCTVLYCTTLYCTAGGTSAPSTSDHGLERDGIGTEILRP